ncbi:MAG: beta-lactamase family protein [Actinomycetota bacterium]|nr:beta-lactamase family protein [Actinomycetota bacterium]
MRERRPAGGVDPERVDALLARARREVDDGLLPSCQVALARHGELIVFEAFGEATTATRYTVFSCTKPLVAAAVWVLMGDGRLDVSRPVAHYIPEFATFGKEVVTVEQVLLHTSGFPHAPLGPPEWDTREGRLRAFRRWELSRQPGVAYEYHPSSAHWVLAELVERAGGMDFRDFVHQRVTRPAGIAERVLGIPPGHQQGIARLEVRGQAATADELEAVLGVRELPLGEVTNEVLVAFNRPDVRAVGVPGAGAVMRADQLALFYQALLHNPGRIWDPAVLADATATVRCRLGDPLFAMPANRTLGLVQAGDDGLSFLRGFGTTVSPRTFGHGGAAGQIAWADPASGLSMAYLTNGIDANVLRQGRRGIDLSSLAGACATEPGAQLTPA